MKQSSKRTSKYLFLCAAGAGLALLVLLGYRLLVRKPAEYVYMAGNIRNYQDFPMFHAFETEIQEAGASPHVIESDEKISAIEQTQLLKKAVGSQTKCVLVNPVRSDNLIELLEEYRSQGIPVISCISDMDAAYRDLYIGITDPDAAGKKLLHLAEEHLGAAGCGFALLGEGAHTVSTTNLTMVIRHAFETGQYGEMMLTDTIFRTNDDDKTRESLERFLDDNPQTTVLISLSEYMTQTVCALIQEKQLEERITVIGSGTPEMFAEELSDEALQLILYYQDMEAFGKTAAGIALKLTEENWSPQAGEALSLDGQEYTVVEQGLVAGEESHKIYVFEDYLWMSSEALREEKE